METEAYNNELKEQNSYVAMHDGRLNLLALTLSLFVDAGMNMKTG